MSRLSLRCAAQARSLSFLCRPPKTKEATANTSCFFLQESKKYPPGLPTRHRQKKPRDRQFPAPESLDSRGPDRQVFPQTLHTPQRGIAPASRAVPTFLFFFKLATKRMRKRLRHRASGFLHRVSPTPTEERRGEDEIAKPGSPAQKNKKYIKKKYQPAQSSLLIPSNGKEIFPQCNCRGRSSLAYRAGRSLFPPSFRCFPS